MTYFSMLHVDKLRLDVLSFALSDMNPVIALLVCISCTLNMTFILVFINLYPDPGLPNWLWTTINLG